MDGNNAAQLRPTRAEAWGPLRRTGPDGGRADSLVVLLHGVGADGADLIGLAPELAPSVPGAAFLAPDAPRPFDGGSAPGREWFSLADRDPRTLARLVAEAAPGLDAWLDAQLAARDLPPSRLALIGFSQGAMLALHVGLRRRVPPAAVLAFSGAMATGATLAAEATRPYPPVLLVHGEADEVVPAWASRAAESALRAVGAPVESLFVPGLGHGVEGRGLAAAAALLRRALGPGGGAPSV